MNSRQIDNIWLVGILQGIENQHYGIFRLEKDVSITML